MRYFSIRKYFQNFRFVTVDSYLFNITHYRTIHRWCKIFTDSSSPSLLIKRQYNHVLVYIVNFISVNYHFWSLINADSWSVPRFQLLIKFWSTVKHKDYVIKLVSCQLNHNLSCLDGSNPTLLIVIR